MSDTPGSILKKARENQNLNIAQAVKGTRIRALYLRAMEADDYSVLPSVAQLKGFLRIYADFLDLDKDNLISMLPNDMKSRKQRELKIQNLKPVKSDVSTDNEALVPKESPIIEIGKKINEEQLPRATNKTDTEIGLSTAQDEISIEELEPQSRSEAIFSSIGNKLREQREILDISLKEIESNTHVLRRYLEAIEAGQFQNLETTVQTRGMLTNYAQFLNMDVDGILLQYADGLQAQLEETHARNQDPTKKTKTINRTLSKVRRILSIDLLIGSMTIILLLIFIVWGTGKVIDQYNEPAVQATSASISDVILTPLVPSQEVSSSDNQPTITSTPAATSDATQLSGTQVFQQGQVQIQLVVLQRTWVRVTVDGVVKLENRVEAGSAFPFTGYTQIEILSGNGAALQVIYNQADLGLMGEFGQVVNVIYTPSSILSPTATVTPTATITAVPSITPVQSNTPLP